MKSVHEFRRTLIARRVTARLKAAEEKETLSPQEAGKLPVGSIVWKWVSGRVDESPLIVIPGGALTQIALLPERAGGEEPGGDPPANWGREFVLVHKGSGSLPTNGTARRHAEAWMRESR